MHLIIGGAWQGKLEYAAQRFNLTAEDIHDCSCETAPDMSKRCFNHYERYIRYCFDRGLSPNIDFPPDSIVICQDIFCGIVSADPGERAWRVLSGRTLTAMAAQAETVTRLFCGIPTKLK